MIYIIGNHKQSIVYNDKWFYCKSFELCIVYDFHMNIITMELIVHSLPIITLDL